MSVRYFSRSPRERTAICRRGVGGGRCRGTFDARTAAQPKGAMQPFLNFSTPVRRRGADKNTCTRRSGTRTARRSARLLALSWYPGASRLPLTPRARPALARAGAEEHGTGRAGTWCGSSSCLGLRRTGRPAKAALPSFTASCSVFRASALAWRRKNTGRVSIMLVSLVSASTDTSFVRVRRGL